MKIVDSFIFYNELDILNYRLSILDDYVDYFVLVESRYTFAGDLKPLYYLENKDKFEKFNSKVIHRIIHSLFLLSFQVHRIRKTLKYKKMKKNKKVVILIFFNLKINISFLVTR